MGDVALDANLDRLVMAFANKGSASEIAGTLLHAVIDRWVDVNVHGPILLWCLISGLVDDD
jgi:hypothetical protein